MTTQDELVRLREELNRIQEQTKKSGRRTGIGFGLLILGIIMALAYAFVQKIIATKNAEEALRQRDLAEVSMQLARQSKSEAEAMISETARQLEECRSRK